MSVITKLQATSLYPLITLIKKFVLPTSWPHVSECHYALVRMRKQGHTVVWLCVFLSVCYQYIGSPGEIQVLVYASLC